MYDFKNDFYKKDQRQIFIKRITKLFIINKSYNLALCINLKMRESLFVVKYNFLPDKL